MSPAELRAKTLYLLGRGDSQRAFDLALSADDVSVVEWLCDKAREPGFQCSLDTLHLSQDIWVCLMQQLSSNLGHGTSGKIHDIEVHSEGTAWLEMGLHCRCNACSLCAWSLLPWNAQVAFSNINFEGELSTSFVTEVTAGVVGNLEDAMSALKGQISVGVLRRMHFLARMMQTAL